MTPIRPLRVAVVGNGPLADACAQALQHDPVLRLAGVVAAGSLPAASHDAAAPPRGTTTASHVRELPEVDAALLCTQPLQAPGLARELVQGGLPLVEGAVLEGAALGEYHEMLARLAHRHRVPVVVGAGWEQGLVQLQQLFERLIPQGQTRLRRHACAGLHHSAVVAGMAGVRAALCTELDEPAASKAGLHRYVYVELEPKADPERVRRAIAGDPLFVDEPTEVLVVADVEAIGHAGQGVLLERLQAAGAGPHASLLLEARLDAAVFSAQLMLDALRALPLHGPGLWRYTPFGLVAVSRASHASHPR